jgi:hypothetical protein
MMTGEVERLRWYQLAEEWLALSHVPFQMWKGDHGSDERRDGEARAGARQIR